MNSFSHSIDNGGAKKDEERHTHLNLLSLKMKMKISFEYDYFFAGPKITDILSTLIANTRLLLKLLKLQIRRVSCFVTVIAGLV